MRRDYGGVGVDLDDTVWIFDVYAAEPIFHHAELDEPRDGRRVVRTRCGEPVHSEDRRDPAMMGSAHWLPPRHAVRFARPCLTCWPQLRAQPTLFARRRRQRSFAHVEQEAIPV